MTLTFNDLLLDLLAKLRAVNKPVLISWDTVQLWPDDALTSFLQLGLLSPASAAQSIECTACEKRCFLDITTLPHDDPVLTRAFIVCDDADMQSQIGRVQIPLIQLQQWQGSIKLLAKVIAELLGLKDKIEFTANQSDIKLGMLKGAKGRRLVSLSCSDLSLKINKHVVPIAEVVYFEEKQLLIDQDCIDDLLNRKPLNQSKTYSSSIDRREARKRETKAMYQDWNDAYLRLEKMHPDKSKKWCSMQIAKMDISKDKSAEYIRKNMIL